MQTYLDNSATTRISEGALATYCEVSREHFGNPSSLHALGFDAEKYIRSTREELGRAIGAKDGTFVFTASGTEANNLAILGRAHAKERYRKGAKILTTEGEHASVSSPLEKLAAEGYRIARIPTKDGVLDMDVLEKELTPDVILVTMMMVNNETGAFYDLGRVSALMSARCPDAVLHADCTQSFMKVPFTVKSAGADLITLSSHKIHGPKGVGALYVSGKLIKEKGLAAQILGGGQENGLRSGTENVPGIAAFGTACKEEREAFNERSARIGALRERLLNAVQTDERLREIKPVLPVKFAPHLLNLTLPMIKSETMLHYLSGEGVYVSSGSACSSNAPHLSSALTAFGRTPAEADCSIRISFSYENTEEDVDKLVEALAGGLAKLSRMRR
ncbi:MAG: cysteine desulfurase [Clostridia bacterium]|nr:cysteine desulfurase [Clostridia bacterium]